MRKPILATALLASAMIATLGAGCVTERHDAIPPSALLGAEGEKRLAFTSDGPGTIYVFDTFDNKLVYSGDVLGQRTVTVDPEKNQIMVDGTLVQDKVLARGHTHKIFFKPSTLGGRM